MLNIFIVRDIFIMVLDIINSYQGKNNSLHHQGGKWRLFFASGVTSYPRDASVSIPGIDQPMIGIDR